MHKLTNQKPIRNAAAVSLGQVLGEAMQEINCLEEKNNKMQDVLNDLQTGILNLNNSVTSIKLSELENQKDKSNEINLSYHLKEFKRISSDITSKLHLTIQGDTKDGLLQAAYQSGLCDVKKKLSSLSMIVQQLSQEGKGENETGNVSSAPSMCLADDDCNTSA